MAGDTPADPVLVAFCDDRNFVVRHGSLLLLPILAGLSLASSGYGQWRSAATIGNYSRDVIRMINREPYIAFSKLSHSVATGRPAFEEVFGNARFDWLAEHPEEAGLFQRAMIALSRPSSARPRRDLSARCHNIRSPLQRGVHAFQRSNSSDWDRRLHASFY
jgi:hypothetical protein